MYIIGKEVGPRQRRAATSQPGTRNFSDTFLNDESSLSSHKTTECNVDDPHFSPFCRLPPRPDPDAPPRLFFTVPRIYRELKLEPSSAGNEIFCVFGVLPTVNCSRVI